MSGKGSSPRPFSVDHRTFENNWDRIFGKKSQSQIPDQPDWDHYSGLPNPDAYGKEDDADKS